MTCSSPTSTRARRRIVPTHPDYDPDEGLEQFLTQIGNSQSAVLSGWPIPRSVAASSGKPNVGVGGRDRLQSRRVDIAVVDDHPIILDSIASWGVAAEGDIRVVVTAATVDALLAGPGRHADVVLLDLDLDLDDGTTVERNVAAILAAGPAVLVLSASDKPLAARAAIRAGARGYAMKNEQTSQIRVAIREVAAGRDWISPRLACIFAADDAADSPSLGVHDGTVRAWRLADGTPVGEPLTGHSDSVNAMAVGALPDGTPVIVTGGGDGTVRAWRLADGTPVGEPLTGHGDSVNAMAVGALPDGTPVIVTGGGDGRSGVAAGRRHPGRKPLTGHSDSVTAVAIAPDGTWLVSAGRDRTVRIWGPATGAEQARLVGRSGWVSAVAFSLDGRRLASAGDDGTVRIWDLALAA